MTNFERWKARLKPEDLADFPCVECAPFMRRECERSNTRRPLPICVAKFLAWANAEASPDDHIADVGKMMREEEEPPVLLYEERGEKVQCPVCGEPAEPIKNKPGVVFCKRCGGPLFVRREGNATSRGIKEQFLALGEKAIKKIDFDKVADAEWEICSGSYERMLSWARGAIEGAVSKVVAGVTGGEEAEFACGCIDAKAFRKHGRLRIELNHRRTKQYVEVEEPESEEGEK